MCNKVKFKSIDDLNNMTEVEQLHGVIKSLMSDNEKLTEENGQDRALFYEVALGLKRDRQIYQFLSFLFGLMIVIQGILQFLGN